MGQRPPVLTAFDDESGAAAHDTRLSPEPPHDTDDEAIVVRGARQNNLKNLTLECR